MDEIIKSFKLLRPYRTQFFIILAITLTLGIIEVIPAFIYKQIVDTITQNPTDPSVFPTILTIILVYFVVLTMQTALNILQRYSGNVWSKSIYYDLIYKVGENIYDLKQDYFHKNTIGEITEKLRNGVSYISLMYFHYPIDIISPLFTGVFSLAILTTLDVRIGVAMLLTIPFMILFFKKALTAVDTYAPQKRKYEEKAHGKLNEALYSIESTKVNSRPTDILDYTQQYQQKALRMLIEQNKGRQIWGGLAGQMQDVAMVVGLGLSAYFIYHGAFTLGELVLVTSLSTNLLRPIRLILFQQLELKEAIIGIRRFFEILEAPKESEHFLGNITPKTLKGFVTFDSVSFGYEEKQNILKNISFDIRPGTTVALVGPSGSGKTTITKLITGLYIAQKGEVRIDDIPITEYDLASLRKNMAVVFQDPFVFSDTLTNNLKFVKPKATKKEIDQVVKLSNMSEFVRTLPDGLETQVGERGVRLSGGQKQRLAIAQALLKDASIIIFDEATSSLDAENEQLIQEAMKRLMRDRTTFIISHRLATVMHADTILVLQNGKIVEQGNHRELKAQNGLYHKLYTLQTKDPEQLHEMDLV